ncbi:hypothetical protein G3O08_19060 [Cryomorpha ignava]|uniref:Uncharacterized protein n=1 Tax=Cryomorpha ignava TaxID=101383 RepID=A0A7K3WVR3_9FLAO|nr:hypothetical protein [Cryomorpha ignava]NEN25596.1 hypothetical protein [Cryomorpha ignava]
MTINQKITSVLFMKETIDRVKQQFNKGPQIIPLEEFDITFRLYKPTNFNINLEVPIKMPIEGTSEDVDFGELGKGIKRSMVMFWKPIGFYTLKRNLLSSDDIELNILKEYEDSLDSLRQQNKISSSIKINKLSLKENALIAGFSKETSLRAAKNEDCFSFISNGLLLDIYMTDEGYPEVFLDDKYETQGAIVKYRLYDNPAGIDPIVNYKELFDKMYSMSLLTAHGKSI